MTEARKTYEDESDAIDDIVDGIRQLLNRSGLTVAGDLTALCSAHATLLANVYYEDETILDDFLKEQFSGEFQDHVRSLAAGIREIKAREAASPSRGRPH